MLDNINFMDNLNAKWSIEQVNIIFHRWTDFSLPITCIAVSGGHYYIFFFIDL